jgi:hypothetical protein
MEYYSALKRNGLSNHKKRGGISDAYYSDGRSQSEKSTDWVIPTIGPSGKVKCQIKDHWLPRIWEGGRHDWGAQRAYGTCYLVSWWICVVACVSSAVG